MKLFYAFIPLFMIFSGCASTGVVSINHDTFMISKKSAAGVFGTAGGVTADIYVEANEYCERSGKSVETVTLDVKEAKPFVRTGSATLNFKCLSNISKDQSSHHSTQ